MSNHSGGEPAAQLDLVEAAPGEEEARQAASREAASREAASREAADTVMQAFGGVRGMVDMTLPGLVFIVTYNITHQVPAAAWAALGLSGLFVVARLARRETVQHAFSGVFGVAIGAWISMKTGKAENFYLPGLLWSVGYCIGLAVSALVRWPMIGLMLGPITGEMFTWRKQNPGRLAAYTKATWAWVVVRDSPSPRRSCRCPRTGRSRRSGSSTAPRTNSTSPHCRRTPVGRRPCPRPTPHSGIN
ncbi:DUF3159 domain-containing protein [Kitasatospora sp. NPDC058263]